jgi:hypothetical protein
MDTMKQIPNFERVETNQQSSRDAFRVLRSDPRDVTRRRLARDNWFIALMVVCTCVFAGTVAAYVLHPAINTLTSSTSESSSSEGP